MKKEKDIKQPNLNKNFNMVDVFEKIGNKGIFIAISLVILVSFFVFKDFILLKKIYLFKDIGSDSLNASWPFMMHAAENFGSKNLFSWSFNFGMGQNASTYPFYDPFDVLLYGLNKDKIIYFLAFKEILKIVLSSILFYKFLKLLNINNYVSIIGALLYSFCGYMILGSGWFVFSFEVFNMAFLLWAFEQFFQKNKWYWFPLPIFLIGISRPFNLWPFGIFIFIYIVFRVYQTQSKIDFKRLGLLILKIFGLVLLGIGLSAPLFLEHIQVMIDSPRVSGPDSYFSKLASGSMFATADKIQFGTEIMRFFSNDILGSGIKFKGWQNFLEAPMFYCGLISLLLLPQVFQFLDKRVKKASIVILLIWLLPIIFPYFRQAFWIFSGDYYRTYSFFVALVIIIFSIMAFNNIVVKRKINLKILIGTVIALLLLINYPFFKDKSTTDGFIVFFSIFLIIVNAIILYFIATKNDNQNYKYALLFSLVLELSYFSWCTVNRRDHITVADLNQKIGYNDYSVEAVNFIKQKDKSFYRIDKSYSSTPAMHGSLNDAMVNNYFGTSCYNSFNQKNYINYFKTMGVISKVNELESRWAPGLINRFMLESINDVKYVLTKNTNNPVWQNSFDSIAKFGDVVVLKNKNVLPLGFAYDKYLKLSEFDKLSLLQKDWISTKACIINDDEAIDYSKLAAFNLKDTIPLSGFTFDAIRANFDSLKLNPFNITNFTQTNIKGKITLDKSKMVYFSIPFDNGWKVYNNDKEISKVMLSNGMTGIFLDKGNYNIELNYSSTNTKRGSVILIISSLVFLLLLAYTKFRKSNSKPA